MPAATFDLTSDNPSGNHALEQGATYRRVFMVQTPEGGVYPLTGFLARAQMRKSTRSAEPFVSLDSATVGGLTIDTTAGSITLDLSAEDTAAITAVAGVWDLELVAPGGDVIRLLQGAVEVSREVTREVASA